LTITFSRGINKHSRQEDEAGQRKEEFLDVRIGRRIEVPTREFTTSHGTLARLRSETKGGEMPRRERIDLGVISECEEQMEYIPTGKEERRS
jgi:hypothetical protein